MYAEVVCVCVLRMYKCMYVIFAHAFPKRKRKVESFTVILIGGVDAKLTRKTFSLEERMNKRNIQS